MSHTIRLLRFARYWHARIGVLATFIFLLLTTTGIALNHAGALGLDRHMVKAAWLMRWYGLRTAVPDQAYVFPHGYFTWDAQRWVMDGKVVSGNGESPLGVVEIDKVRYAASRSALYLFDMDGNLIERIAGAGLPAAPLRLIGEYAGHVVVLTAQGAFASADAIEWQPVREDGVTWATSVALPPARAGEVAALLAPGLPLERIVLDAHSGRIFGKYGSLVVDMAAMVLIVLSISGFWIYLCSIRTRN